MSQFIESIKVEDQEIFLADLHQKRINDTFSHFGKAESIDLQKIYKHLEHDEIAHLHLADNHARFKHPPVFAGFVIADIMHVHAQPMPGAVHVERLVLFRLN